MRSVQYCILLACYRAPVPLHVLTGPLRFPKDAVLALVSAGLLQRMETTGYLIDTDAGKEELQNMKWEGLV